MRGLLGGYSIIEVLIFLGVTGALFAASVAMLSGRDANTQFSQAMQDVELKMQDWINDVTNGFPGGEEIKYECALTGAANRPKIDTVSGSKSTTPNCVFLGKVIQLTASPDGANTNSEKAFIYSVFGRRLKASDKTLVGNMADAAPVAAAAASGSGNADLTETYEFSSGVRVKSIASASPVGSNPVPDGSRLVGFFLSLNTEVSSTANGNSSLQSFVYPVNGNEAPKSDTILECIKMTLATGPTCTFPVQPPGLRSWDICFVSPRNDKATAMLTVNSSDGWGATTNLEFKDC